MWNPWIRFYQIAKRFVFIIKDAWKVFTFFFKCGNGEKIWRKSIDNCINCNIYRKFIRIQIFSKNLLKAFFQSYLKKKTPATINRVSRRIFRKAVINLKRWVLWTKYCKSFEQNHRSRVKFPIYESFRNKKIQLTHTKKL